MTVWDQKETLNHHSPSLYCRYRNNRFFPHLCKLQRDSRRSCRKYRHQFLHKILEVNLVHKCPRQHLTHSLHHNTLRMSWFPDSFVSVKAMLQIALVLVIAAFLLLFSNWQTYIDSDAFIACWRTSSHERRRTSDSIIYHSCIADAKSVPGVRGHHWPLVRLERTFLMCKNQICKVLL